MRSLSIFVGCTALLIAMNAFAAEPTPQPLPPEVPAEEQPEPEVSIVHKNGETIEEYRLGGVLYMIKIAPKKGAAYYLVDTDGNGSLDTRRADTTTRMLVPSWVIFRWK